MKNYGLLVFLSSLLYSCNFVPKEVPNSQELLRRELHAIDWSKVDDYPSYPSCDSIKSKEAAKICFFDRLSFETLRLLQNDSLVRLSTIDTVQFMVTLTCKSELQFKTETVNEKLLPKWMLDSIMIKNQKHFSKIEPASKRGIPVTTQFQLGLKIPSSLD